MIKLIHLKEREERYQSSFIVLSIFLLIFFNVGIGVAQSQIKGQVIDSTLRKPLPSVSVKVQGTAEGTVTGVDGRFKIEASPDDYLIFSSIGYATKIVPVGSATNLEVQLGVSENRLDRLVVVAFGTQKRRNVTGSVADVDLGKFKDLPVIQVTQKLQGQVAGVQINQTSGQPGRGMNVKIRGQMSISAGSQPLYVVDGFPISGDISFINPNEIETISVLKDAAATALYGSRAANGVIMITTKGSKGGNGTSVGLNVSTNILAAPKYNRLKMMNAEEFAQFKKEYYEDEGVEVPSIFQDPSQYKDKDNDWYQALLQQGVSQNYTLTIMNNTDKVSTSVIAGVTRQKGLVINTRYDRYSLRINSDYSISDKLKVGVKFAPSYIFNNQPRSDGGRGSGLLYDALVTWPIYPIRDENGELTLSNSLPANTGNIWSYPNWVRASKEIKDESRWTNLLGTSYVEYEPIKGLSLKSSMGLQYKNTNYFFFHPSTSTYDINVSVPVTATAVRNNMNETLLSNDNIATYSRSFGKHNLKILGGFTWQKYQEKDVNVEASGFPDDRINSMQSAEDISRGGTNNGRNVWTIASFIGSVNYDYLGKYLVSASIRTDGSSRFGSKNLWGTFPSVSLGWVATDEDFVRDNLKWLSYAKIRTSYGSTGNNNIGNYTQYAVVNGTLRTVFNDNIESGSALNSLSNPNLGWEKTSEFDLGLDLSFLKDRVQLTYDYYLKYTTDLLYNVQVPQESGFSGFTDNIGKLKFWGHEFSITSKNIVGKFNWTTTANITFNRNQVISLSEGLDRVYGGHNITMVGQPFGVFWGLKKIGHYQNDNDVQNSPSIPGKSAPGTIKFEDINHDNLISFGGDNDDRAVIGNPFPKFSYGITNNFHYGRFDFQVIGYGSYGKDVYMDILNSTGNLDGAFNMVARAAKRWRSESNPGDGFFGTTVGGGTYTGPERDWSNSQLIADASFFTIKNLTLGYRVPIESKTVKNFRIYASIEQLYTFTKYWAGPNPETSSSNSDLGYGSDNPSYPVPRVYSLGVNLNF